MEKEFNFEEEMKGNEVYHRMKANKVEEKAEEVSEDKPKKKSKK